MKFLCANLPWMDNQLERELVFAQRECLRISRFLDDMVEQGRLTEFESELIRAEKAEIYRQAGYLDSNDRTIGNFMGDEEPAVLRQSNHQRRQKLIELRPELQQELIQAIDYRQELPSPVMTPVLEKPGEALARYRRLSEFIMDKRDCGKITREQAYEAYKPALDHFENEGINIANLSTETDKLALIRATQETERKILELCPELADEIRDLHSGRSK